MNKRFSIILVLITAAFFGMLFFTKKEASAPDGTGGEVTVSNHIYGAKKDSVVLTEYGDFQCPACYRFFPIIQQLKDKYKDKDVSFQFRHYPLTEIHQHALISSRAAEAAGLQNKFFEMHDLLYQNQPQWSANNNPQSAFEGFASQLSLDVNKFKEDMKSDRINRIVQADRAEAKKLGFTSTPSFQVNGKELTDVRDTVEYFSKFIDDELAAKKTTP